MQFTVFGASGRIGQMVVAEALQRGHSVVTFVHRSNPFEQAPDITTVKGDLGDHVTVATALKGSDAVISALGSWGTPTKDVLTRGIEVIIPAMHAQNIQRIVTVTGAGARLPHEAFTPLERLNRLLIAAVAPKVLHDADQHLALLASSQLNWTSVRAPAMDNRSSTRHTLTDHRQLPAYFVPRKAIASCLVDLAESAAYSQQAPFIKA